MPHPIWKGAISFGLVNAPVALFPASREGGIDFDWLDKRTMDPVGYKRINKRSGKENDKENIYLTADGRGSEKVYALLGQAMLKTRVPRCQVWCKAYIGSCSLYIAPLSVLPEKPSHLRA